MDLGLIPTLIGVAVCGAIAAIGAWRGAQPPNPARGPRLIPWTLIAVVAAGIGVLFLVHIVNLAGFETGQGRGMGRGF